MNIRLAACEPCRRAKLACGHEQPTCVRCRRRGQAELCSYRNQPFKRRKRHITQSDREKSTTVSTTTTATQPHRYPNPGFLGSSSYTTIFSQVSSSTGVGAINQHQQADSTPLLVKDQVAIGKSTDTLTQFLQFDVANLMSLVEFWLGEGVNLPLAGPLIPSSIEAVSQLWDDIPSTSPTAPHLKDWISSHAVSLLQNTHKPINLDRNTTVDDFFSQMTGDSLRWETVGLFLTAASRAALDTMSFAPLYSGEEQGRALVRKLTYLADSCLEMCISVDHLNDLQIVLQYENLVVHSQIDGDESYHCWRRMGDLSSSLFALGFHEAIDENVSAIPGFIAELRKSTFARTYTADKSLAVFLGRPPRIIKAYCDFQLPSLSDDPWARESLLETSDNQRPPNGPAIDGDELCIGRTGPINYTADTVCSAIFACLKEDILALARRRSSVDIRDDAEMLRQRIESDWLSLPPHFKLTTSLKDCRASRFERDFLVGTRLDYLHTNLLLNLVSIGRATNLNEPLLVVAKEMLSLVVELIILRDRLVNSGTGLIWKVAQFGLPAAGVISLALLNSSIDSSITQSSRTKMVQDLSVLVAEIRTGAVIQDGEPNFALFMRATQTIQSLLDSLIVWRSPTVDLEPQQGMGSILTDGWGPGHNLDPWEFEIGFWANLAEHPTLLQQDN